MGESTQTNIGHGGSSLDHKHVYPTGTCFDDALDLIQEILKAEPDRFSRGEIVLVLRLVHGVCRHTDGTHYAHAWVENVAADTCLFVGIYRNCRSVIVAARPEFYSAYRVVETQIERYTYPQVILLNHTTGHYGPWTQTLRDLCRGPSIECPQCGRTSYNRNDFENRYCGNCHQFLENME
jgi:hypothetical protein